MIFRVGDVLKWITPEGYFLTRVQLAAPEEDFLVLFAFLDYTAQPEVSPLRHLPTTPFKRTKLEIEAAVTENDCMAMQEDLWSAGIVPRNDMEEKGRDTLWNALQPIVADGRSHLFSDTRGPLITQAMEKTGLKKWTLYIGMRRFWQSNGNINALTPAFRQRGGLGGQKVFRTHKKAKFLFTEQDRANIAKAIDKHYLARAEHTIDDTFTFLLNTFYSINGVRMLQSPDKRGFKYHAYNILSKIPAEKIIERKGLRIYLKDCRPKTSSIRGLSTAPGDRIETDATSLDVNCVCEVDRSLVVGRPNLYVSADVFTGAPAGIHLTLENTSYIEGSLCIAHSTCNKDQYLADLGLKLPPGSWPFEGVGKQYIVDGGEFDSSQAGTTSKAVGAPVVTMAGYRPDWKATVELLIGLINRIIRKLEGRIRKQNRGDRDPKLDACLTLREVEKICALAVVVLWKRIRHQRCLDRQMMEAGVLPIPLRLWTWGCENRGYPKRANHENYKVSLLPRKPVKVTNQGIKFGDLYYECETAKTEGWFTKGYFIGREVWISYHPRNTNQFFLIHEGATTTAEPCVLTKGSSEFADVSHEDVRAYFRNLRKETYAEEEGPYRQGKMDIQRLSSDLQKNGKKAVATAIEQSGISNNARKKGVRANRVIEQQRMREQIIAALKTNPQPDKPQTLQQEGYFPPPSNSNYLEELLAKRTKKTS